MDDVIIGWIGEGRAVNVVYFDFSKVSDTVSHNILVKKKNLESVGWMNGW